MQLVKHNVARRVLAVALMCFSTATLTASELPIQQASSPAQQTAAQQAAQQQNIPDAPRPQTLPTLNTLTPVAPALPAGVAPTPAPSTTTTPSDSSVPGTSLPATPAPTQQPGEEPAPEIPDAGQGPAATFKLGTVQVNFVEVPFTVKDSKNQLVPNLTYRDVRVYENGLRQQMRLFTTDPFPLSVALVIDQSVTFDTMTKINNALGALQGAFTKYDEVAVFTYNNGVKLQDGEGFDAAQSERLAAILQRSKGTGRDPLMPVGGPLDYGPQRNGQSIPTAENQGRTGPTITVSTPKEFHTLNDAIFAAAQQTTHAGPGRRRIVYVISDGKEYGSKVKQSEVIRYCQTNKVSVYATLVGDSSIPGLGFLDRIHLPLTMRDDVLPKYAAATGGQIDPEFRQRGIEQSFAKITEEVRTQYTIGYYSHEPAIDGKFRKLEVRVLRPNLTVISKDGYYPTPEHTAPATTTPSATP